MPNGINLCCGLTQWEAYQMGTLKVASDLPVVNPFEILATQHKKTLECPVYTLKQLSGHATVAIFGVTADTFYKAVIAQTEANIKVNDAASVTTDFMPLITGKIARIDYLGNGTITLYINTSAIVDREAGVLL